LESILKISNQFLFASNPIATGMQLLGAW